MAVLRFAVVGGAWVALAMMVGEGALWLSARRKPRDRDGNLLAAYMRARLREDEERRRLK